MEKKKQFLRELRALRKKHGFYPKKCDADETYYTLLCTTPVEQVHPLLNAYGVTTFVQLKPHLKSRFASLNFFEFAFGPECQHLSKDVVVRMVALPGKIARLRMYKGLFNMCISHDHVKSVKDLNAALLHQMIHLYVKVYHATETVLHGDQFKACAARMSHVFSDIDVGTTCRLSTPAGGMVPVSRAPPTFDFCNSTETQ